MILGELNAIAQYSKKERYSKKMVFQRMLYKGQDLPTYRRLKFIAEINQIFSA